MTYTGNITFQISRETEQGAQKKDSVNAQTLFDEMIISIKDNTSDSNRILQLWLQKLPELATMKDSNQLGLPLLFYAVEYDNIEAAKLIIRSFKSANDINIRSDSMAQNALHHAVFKDRPEMVDLFIENGADVNLQDQSQQTALWLASANGNLPIVRKITAVNGAQLGTPNIDNWSPLHVAAFYGHLQVAEHLVESGADINQKGFDKRTPLHLATLKSLEVAKFLTKSGADTNAKDSFDQSPLRNATDVQSVELVELMVEMGADPYATQNDMNTVLDVTLCKKDVQLLKALWNKGSTRNLYHAAVSENKENLNIILSENSFTEEELRVMFLSCVNHHKFESASILLKHQRGLQSLYTNYRSAEKDLAIDKGSGVSKEKLRETLLHSYKTDYKNLLVFEGTSFEKKSELVLDAFSQIGELLCDIQICIELLKPLDEELKYLLPQLSDIESEQYTNVNELLWPGNPNGVYQPLEKKRVLRKLLRSHLQKHGIESQDEIYTFAGFVDTDKANELVRGGALFKEQFLLGNANIHGLYTHYLQWFIIAQAIDSGRIKLQNGLTLKEILQASVDVQTKDKKPAWTFIVDSVLKSRYANQGDVKRLVGAENKYDRKNVHSRFTFSSVHDFSSFLYTSAQLPHLRGYLLDSLYKNIVKMQKVMKNKYPNENDILQEHIVTGQAIAYWAFGMFNIGLSRDDVADYYRNMAKTRAVLDENTGIVTKEAP